MPTVFMVLVLLAIISPTAFGNQLIAVLYPLAEQGLVLAIMVAGIIFLLKGFK